MANINVFGTLHNVTGEPIAKAAQIKDDSVNKTQAEINQIAIANGLANKEVDTLPNPTAETRNILYLTPADDPEENNIKNEWLTLIKYSVIYNNVEYGINYLGNADTIYAESDNLPTANSSNEGTVYLKQSSILPSIDERVDTDESLYISEKVNNTYSNIPQNVKIGDTYEISTGDYKGIWVRTQNGWTNKRQLAIYYWEKIGSKKIEIEPVRTAVSIWNPIIEIFVDRECTTKPSGYVNSVYAKINKKINTNLLLNEIVVSIGDVGAITWYKTKYSSQYLTNANIELENGSIMPGVYKLDSTGSAKDVTGWFTKFYNGNLSLM